MIKKRVSKCCGERMIYDKISMIHKCSNCNGEYGYRLVNKNLGVDTNEK